jgi:hypothetical protein
MRLDVHRLQDGGGGRRGVDVGDRAGVRLATDGGSGGRLGVGDVGIEERVDVHGERVMEGAGEGGSGGRTAIALATATSAAVMVSTTQRDRRKRPAQLIPCRK